MPETVLRVIQLRSNQITMLLKSLNKTVENMLH